MSAPTTLATCCKGSLGDRCSAGQQLWTELIEARDAVRLIAGSGSKIGYKPALDEFARRRDLYHRHKGLVA